MASYIAVPGAPLQSFAPRLVVAPGRPRGPVSTAAVNVPALVLLVVAVAVLCAVMLLARLARLTLHPTR